MMMPRLSAISKALQRGFVRVPHVKWRGRSKGTPSGGGGGPVTNLAVGLNLGGVSYFSGYWPFIDRMRCTDNLWSVSAGGSGTIAEGDARVNANYEPSALPNGQRIDRLLYLELEQLRATSLVKTGVWKITWTGPTVAAGTIVDIVTLSGGTSGFTSSGNQATFTSDATLVNLYVRIQNNTGATASYTNIKLFHTAHETDLNAGEILDPDWIASMQSYPYRKFLRFLDVLSTNFSSVVNAADWTPLGHLSWCRGGKGCPPEVIGLIAKKFNRDVWVTAPYLATDACLTSLYTKIYGQDVSSATWKVWTEGINEFWNGGFPGANWCANAGSAGLTIVADGGGAGNATAGSNDRWGCGYAHHTMRCWTAAEAVFGTSRIVRCAGLQTGAPAGFTNVWYYRDTTNTLYGGATFASLLTSSHVLTMACYWPDYDGPTAITQKQLLLNDYGANSEASFQTRAQSQIDQVASDATTYIANARSRGVAARVEMYEGNNHTFLDSSDGGSGRPADFPFTATTTYIELSAGDIVVHTDGDQYTCQNSGLSAGHVGFTRYWGRKITGQNRLRLYTSQAAYDADTGNTGAGSVTLNAGSYTNLCNRAKFGRLANKLNAIYQGSTGLAIFQYAVAKLSVTAINCRSFGLFAHGSSSRNENGRFTASFDNTNANGGINSADTPIIDYLQALNTP